MNSIRLTCAAAALACATLSASGQSLSTAAPSGGLQFTLENILITSWRIATNGWQPGTRQPLPLQAAGRDCPREVDRMHCRIATNGWQGAASGALPRSAAR